MQRTKAELEGELSALTESLEALRGVGSEICQLAAEAAKAAEAEAAAHQVCLLKLEQPPFISASGWQRLSAPMAASASLSMIPEPCRT